jgi:hypothetical protein
LASSTALATSPDEPTTMPAIWGQLAPVGVTHVTTDGLGGSDGGEGLVVELAALLLEEDEGGGEAAGGGGEAGGAGGAEDVAGEHGGGTD